LEVGGTSIKCISSLHQGRAYLVLFKEKSKKRAPFSMAEREKADLCPKQGGSGLDKKSPAKRRGRPIGWRKGGRKKSSIKIVKGDAYPSMERKIRNSNPHPNAARDQGVVSEGGGGGGRGRGFSEEEGKLQKGNVHAIALKRPFFKKKKKKKKGGKENFWPKKGGFYSFLT